MLPTTAWTRGKARLKTTTPYIENLNLTQRGKSYLPYGVKTYCIKCLHYVPVTIPNEN